MELEAKGYEQHREGCGMSMAQTPLEVFRAKGIPHRRIEEWKYSDLRSVLDAETVAREGGVQWRVDGCPGAG